ncbi:MAG TPA: dethiobiotin synthase [Acidimicrobiia bacterium]
MLIVVTGTGTDVGKTYVTAATIEALRGASAQVQAWKPVQSYTRDELGNTDAEVLARASGQSPYDVCARHRWLALAMAPPIANAALDGPPFTIETLAKEYRPEPTCDFVFVEGAGGVRSPIADDGDTLALCEALDPDAVVVVAHSRLGTINDTRLTVGALARWPVVVVLNRYDESDHVQRANLLWLRARDGFDVVLDGAELALTLTRRAADRARS